jgi:hypothetical protein
MKVRTRAPDGEVDGQRRSLGIAKLLKTKDFDP